MTFEEILDQAIAMLQRRGRLTYGALKRQFQLDDAYLEDLKNELIEGQRLAIDEGGNVLVWTGGTEMPPRITPPVPQAAATPAVPSPAEAERRQLTVLFCDLVDSTRLASQLDPEDLREVVRAYQEACAKVIARYEGHIAQYLGDGLLVYFGYPLAHEDDAQRAVRTGLGIVEALEQLNARLAQERGVRLAVRLGLHTGRVVVGEMGGSGRQEQLALGEVPNVASRIEGLAAPNSVAISEATFRLVQGYFDCQELGEQTLRGISQPLPVYRVLQESGAQSRLDVASTRGLTPLVGRESEATLLLERWEQAEDGQGQVILLSGEAGIGKSRLVQVLKDHLADEPHTQWECRSSPYYQNTALYPLNNLLQRALQWRQDDTPDERLEKLEHLLSHYRLPIEESVLLFAPLLSLSVPEERYPPLNLSPQRHRQKTLESIVAILLELAEHQPVLFILEDLHWTDPTTLEFLALLIEQSPTASIYILLTCRPHFQPSWHHRSYLTEITVNRLSRDQITRVVEYVAGGKNLPEQLLDQIVEKTDGVPLFVEEMTKSVLETGVLKERDGQYELVGSSASLAIPATLQDALMARLDRLVSAKGIAQLGAVIGRQFSYELLEAVSQLDEPTLQRELGRLVDAELVYQRGLPPHATYTFKHALIQDTAYESLLRNTRQGYHRRIVEVLTERFPEIAETQPELLAFHYTEAGLNEQAIGYWQRAGQRASERSAYPEALSHLTAGLTLLQTLPESLERHQQELPLQTVFGAASVMVKGHTAPEVEAAYTRARVLCQQLGDTQDVFPILLGLWRFNVVRPDYFLAQQLGEDLLGLAEQRDEALLYVIAHGALGATCCAQGELRLAHSHFEEGIVRDTPAQPRSPLFRSGQDLGVVCRAYTAWTLWLMGYPEQALARVHAALALATELTHRFTDVYVLNHAAMLWQFRREVQEVYDHAAAIVTLATELGFPHWLASGTILRGWALMARGQEEEGLTQMRRGLTARRATGAELNIPYYLTLLAEGYGILKQVEAGLNALNEGVKVIERTGQRWYEAELYRLKGELLLQQSLDNAAEAEFGFHQAITIAQSQQAKSWELRTATSLARLWQHQGKCAEAYALLAPLYGWFTEGFDTADLQEAKALLEALA